MSKWYSFEELKQARAPMPLDSETGLPDNHVIKVSERTIRIDGRKLVQNNVSTDTYTLELDAEWDDITPVVIFSNSEGDYKVAYENGPTKIPAAVMAVIGAVDVSVFGLDSTGAVRVVTKAAPNIMNVVESGKFVGEVSEDDISLLGQILAAADRAESSADKANEAASNVSLAADGANAAAERAEKAANLAEEATETANEAADKAEEAAQAAGEKSLYAYADPDNDELIILEYPAFLESEDGGSVYLTLEGSDN